MLMGNMVMVIMMMMAVAGLLVETERNEIISGTRSAL